MIAHQLDETGNIINTILVAQLGENMVDASIGGWIGDCIVNGCLVPRECAPLTMEEFNAPIMAELAAIDAKSIRALREGNAERIADLEQQAEALRVQLRKE